MSVSMVFPNAETRKDRLENVMDVWRKLSGGPNAPIGYDHETYVSESATADRNWCLAYMMKESNSFPRCFTTIEERGMKAIEETLELYFQTCSLTSTCDAMGIMAATLANGGFCPLSGEKVFDPEHVRSVLPLMLTCGMYDYSGQWAYDVGVPAKSGVGGCVFMTLPNVGGFSVWSPRLDSVGNSVRAVHACTELVKHVGIHNFEVFSGLNHTKMNIEAPRYAELLEKETKIFSAATFGDANEMQSIHNSGADIFIADYDRRTALHIAASEGHADVVSCLCNAANGDQAKISAQDRWTGTPLGDAIRGSMKHPNKKGFQDCVEVLNGAGAKNDDRGDVKTKEGEIKNEADAAMALTAAANGDVGTLVHMAASGANIFAQDYDARTALHLASSNGQVEALKYLIAQMPHSAVVKGGQGHNEFEEMLSLLTAEDRFLGTPIMDADRESHANCWKILHQFTDQLKRKIDAR